MQVDGQGVAAAGPTVRVQDLIDRLTVLGLDGGEAQVYVHLSMMGPSKASDVAAALKLHRTEAYRQLQALVQRGFASASLSRPQKFEAAAPEKLFSEMLAAQDARSERIRQSQREIGAALSSLRVEPGAGASRNSFKVLQGRREIYALLERMLREAKEEVACLATHEGTVAMDDMAGTLDLAVRRAREGLRFRNLLRTTPAMRARLAPLADVPAYAVRHIDAEHLIRFVITDRAQLLLWVASDPSTRLGSEDDVAVWTDAPDFVATQAVLFESAWREGRALAELGEGSEGDRERLAVR